MVRHCRQHVPELKCTDHPCVCEVLITKNPFLNFPLKARRPEAHRQDSGQRRRLSVSVKQSGTPDCVPAVFLHRRNNSQELKDKKKQSSP